MSTLHHNDAWELVVLPAGNSIVGCRWVFMVKYLPDGTIETFSPVANLVSVRILIYLDANLLWPLFQFDVENASLYGDLQEEVYIEQPPGLIAHEERNQVCCLSKAQYWLKQSPRA